MSHATLTGREQGPKLSGEMFNGNGARSASMNVGSGKQTLSDALANLNLRDFKAADVRELSKSYLAAVAATCQTTNIQMA